MQKSWWNTLIALVTLLSLATSSCTKEQDCHIPTDITAKLVFGTKELRDSIINTDSVVIDTTYIFYRDSLMELPTMETFSYDTNFIIKGLRGVSTLPFSLDPDTTTIQYIVYPNYDETPNIKDTLTVTYKSHLFFISNSCGFTYNYEIVDAHATFNVFDSISISEREVSTDGSKRHIRLYFFPE